MLPSSYIFMRFYILDTSIYVARRVAAHSRGPAKAIPAALLLPKTPAHPRQTPNHGSATTKTATTTTFTTRVYNGAEIDDAKVIWARELDPEQNGKLFAYFKDSKIWLGNARHRQHLLGTLHGTRHRRGPTIEFWIVGSIHDLNGENAART